MAEQDEFENGTRTGFSFNGVNGATGEYLTPPMSSRHMATLAANKALDPEEIQEIKRQWARVSEPNFAPMYGTDPDDLAETGWGVVFAPDVTDDEKQALSPLLSLRREQANGLYRAFTDERAYRTGDTKQSFLSRSKAGPGVVDPKKVPYYLLIVGSPESIPYRFQYQLDGMYAVGRIFFDTPDEYSEYAKNVIAAETRKICRSRDLTFFGVRNRADAPTQLSADHLIKPLSEYFKNEQLSWNTKCVLAEQATKANLAEVLGGPATPALLVSASHGMAFPHGDPLQLRHQGALLCQDWPGPLKHKGPIPENFYFAGDHVAEKASLQGLIAFFFACYGGGTPKMDDFAHSVAGPQAVVAPNSFVAALPKRLLGHSEGALAIVSHVERAWTYSFLWGRAGEQLATFQSTIGALLENKRIGFAMEYFNTRYLELSSDLSTELEDRKFRRSRPETETVGEDDYLAGLWTANNDARSFVVLGDPAVRLAVKPE
jgi:hypothetical protein